MVIIGYSGHAYVACGILRSAGIRVTDYCDVAPKSFNPFQLTYIGEEQSPGAIATIQQKGFFIGIGDNAIRRKVYEKMQTFALPVNAIHPNAIIDTDTCIASCGIMIAAGVCINPLVTIKEGAICNTGCIIEHECEVGAFAHIGPGAVLCGNVVVGEGSFVGAGAVIRQQVRIGKNVMIGMGAVVVNDIGDNEVVVGNPAKTLIKK